MTWKRHLRIEHELTNVRDWLRRKRGKVSVENRVKNAVAAEQLQNTRADIKEASVQLQFPGADRACDPWKGHQIGERKVDRFMLANILSLFHRRRHGPSPRRLCD